MIFKGDIIITDPCYIVKDERHKTDLKEPEKKDYFSYEDILDYPDVKCSDMNILKGCVDEKELAFLKRISAKSEMYEKESERYRKDMNLYRQETADDWERSNYGENMENIGIHNCITTDTLYGDWSCTTLEKNTNKVLGNFCADAGMVGVFLLDEVLKYNPEFEKDLEKDWVVTVIKNFDGEVEFSVEEDEVSVIGTGNINFYTKQTGL